MTTYLVLFLLLRSVVLPLKAIVMNTLSITAAFGALVWVFQDGNLSALLGFQPLGFVETTLPVILFCVLFGLSMDYEVFLLTRMKEVFDRTGDNREAVAAGLERSGRIVTSAAVVVVVVAAELRHRRHRPHQGARARRRPRGRDRRDDRPGAPRPGDDAPAREMELVDAGLARADRREPPAALRGGDGGARPMTRRHVIRAGRPFPIATPALAAAALAAIVALVAAGCAGTPILANVPAPRPSPAATPASTPAPPPDPQPVVFPRDDGPHDRLTEWWYYTGHLRASDGRRLGFEDGRSSAPSAGTSP